MADKFIIVAEYMNSIEAEMAKQLLEDFNIPAIIVGENSGDGRIGVFETIKLQVQESRAEEAKQILEEQEQGREPEDYEVMDESAEEETSPDEFNEQEER
jgi:hypothetical protein